GVQGQNRWRRTRRIRSRLAAIRGRRRLGASAQSLYKDALFHDLRRASMRTFIAIVAALMLWSSTMPAQELVHFPSLDNTTQLDGYLYRPVGEARRPAIVGLHGCSGMFNRSTGSIFPIYRDWAAELNRRGYVFLLVDSFRPRNHGEMCSILGFELDIYRTRPK